MNLGVYTQSMGISNEVEAIVTNLNKGIEENKLSSASLFFNSTGFNPLPLRCGCFNAADLWNFTGKLITTTLSNVVRANSIVNKAEVYYYYGWEEAVPVLHLINISRSKTTKVLCRNKEARDDYYRLTGREPHGVVNDFDLDQLVELV
jgi:hypothetical protein